MNFGPFGRKSISTAALAFLAPPLLLAVAMLVDPRVNYNRWDNFEYFSVVTAHAHDQWLRGKIPQWNPHQHMGEPTIETIQPAPFYPLYTLVRLGMRLANAPVEYFPQIVTLLHTGIAGLGWYSLLRLLSLRQEIGLLGALSGTTAGYSLILSQVWIFIAAAFAWIPWILLGIVGSLRVQPKVRHHAALAIGLTSSLLLGYPQMGVYSWLLAGLFAAVWAWIVAGALGRLWRLLFVAIGAGLLAAPSWIPGLYFYLASARTSKWSLENYEGNSVNPALAWADWILPSFSYINIYGGLNSAYGYQGAWLVPALVGAYLIARRTLPGEEQDLRRQMKAALICSFLLYVLAVGKHAKLTTILYGLPIWSSFRDPHKFLPFFLACFLLAAACALEICWRHSEELRKFWKWLAAAVLVVMTLWAGNQWFIRDWIARRGNSPYDWRRLPEFPLSLACALLGAAILATCLGKRRWLIALTPVQIVFLVLLCNRETLYTYQLGSMRVSPEKMGISPEYRFLPMSGYRTAELTETPHMGKYGLVHTATLNGLFSATGCASPGMLPKWYLRWLPSNFYGLLDGDPYNKLVGSNLLRSFNIRYYLVAKKDVANRKIVEAVPGIRLVSEQVETLVFEDAQALPRIWLATQVKAYSEDALENALLNREPVTTAFVEGTLPEGVSEASRLVQSSWDGNVVHMIVDTGKPAFLVTAATWYPGWSASVDGKPVAVQRVNGTLLGIAIPPGGRDVKLEYATQGLSIGLGLASLGLTILLVIPFESKLPATYVT